MVGDSVRRPRARFVRTSTVTVLRVGGASVSEQHAGFLINDEGGTAADYLALMAQVQNIVLEKTGVQLEPEVRIIGEDLSAEP